MLPIEGGGGDQIDRSRIDESSYRVSESVQALFNHLSMASIKKLGDDIGQTPQAIFTRSV